MTITATCSTCTHQASNYIQSRKLQTPSHTKVLLNNAAETLCTPKSEGDPDSSQFDYTLPGDTILIGNIDYHLQYTQSAHTNHPSLSYPYTGDLLKLEGHSDTLTPNPLPSAALVIVTPLVGQEWKRALSRHLDQVFAQYRVQGIQHGFHIGLDRSFTCKQSIGNMQSAITHPKPVEDYLQAELQAGRIVGPLPVTVAIHTSRFGVIPNSGQLNKWRLILDLSTGTQCQRCNFKRSMLSSIRDGGPSSP